MDSGGQPIGASGPDSGSANGDPAPRHDRSAPLGPEAPGRETAGRAHRPGSAGEQAVQQRLGSVKRADRFYDEQMLDHLNARMREFVGRQEMFFLATADAKGECDSSFRAGPPGFLRVIDERTLVYPEYRGNGVHASLGNIEENPHVGIMLIDFLQARIGLHVNGRAQVVDEADVRSLLPDLPDDPVPGRKTRIWVQVEVEEAYIHCAKHIPPLQKAPKRTARDWGTDDYKRKGGDFFKTARDAREAQGAEEAPAREHRRHASPPVPVPEPAAEPHTLIMRSPAASAEPVAGEAQSEPQQIAYPVRPGDAEAPDLVQIPQQAARPGRAGAGGAGGAGLPGVEDVAVWRREAERALAEAERLDHSELVPFDGWFATR